MSNFTHENILPDELIEKYMKAAIKETSADSFDDLDCLDVPVGCVIVDKNGDIVAKAHNTRRKTKQICGHAEINAINRFSEKYGNFLLNDCIVFVTLEPCPMCAGALSAAHPKAVYYGAPNIENGSCGTVFNILNSHTKIYGGIMSTEISDSLSLFFQKVRNKKASTL